MSPTGIITDFHALFCRMFGHKMGSRPVVFKTQWHGCCRTHRQRPLRGRPSTSSPNSVVDAVKPIGSAPQGAAIDVIFKLGCRNCRTRRQRPPGGSPSTSYSNSVVDAAEPTGSAPQGGRHRRRLQNLVADVVEPAGSAPGPTINVVFNIGGGRSRTHRQHPSGARHRRCLQNSVTGAAGPTGSAPRGPAINVVFKLGGG
jgi:hypothetical protein